jgi:hypothetical protein
MEFIKEDVIATLKESKCVITFTKVNGEVREMPCTLRSDIVPAYERKTPVTESTKESTTVSVWCLDKQAWRSFRFDSLISITKTPE